MGQFSVEKPVLPGSGLSGNQHQRKVTNGYRAKWAADNEAAVRTAVDTARLAGVAPFQTILNVVVG